MWTVLTSNWFCYFVGIAILLLLVCYVCNWIKNKHPSSPEDTIYYQVTDVDGNKSIIHDSGVKPSENPIGSSFNLQILKTEINDGKTIDLSTPDFLHIGHSPKSLTHKLGVDPDHLNDEGLYYTLSIEVPDGKNPEFPFSRI